MEGEKKGFTAYTSDLDSQLPLPEYSELVKPIRKYVNGNVYYMVRPALHKKMYTLFYKFYTKSRDLLVVINKECVNDRVIELIRQLIEEVEGCTFEK